VADKLKDGQKLSVALVGRSPSKLTALKTALTLHNPSAAVMTVVHVRASHPPPRLRRPDPLTGPAPRIVPLGYPFALLLSTWDFVGVREHSGVWPQGSRPALVIASALRAMRGLTHFCRFLFARASYGHV
jgi:hypothetical protein